MISISTKKIRLGKDSINMSKEEIKDIVEEYWDSNNPELSKSQIIIHIELSQERYSL